MPPTEIWLRTKRGDAPDWPFVAEDADGPQDLAGMTIEFGARARLDDVAYVIHRTTNDGGVVVDDPAAGELTVHLAATDTAAEGTLYWDLQATDAGGRPKTLASGFLIIEPDVVHA